MLISFSKVFLIMQSIKEKIIEVNSKEFLDVRGLSVKDFIKKYKYWRAYKMVIEIAGNTVIMSKYELPGFEGGNGTGGRKVSKGKVTGKESRDKVLYKMSKLLIGYANANFYKRDMTYRFITLEFLERVKDIKTANRYFKIFMQRLRKKYGNFKYLATIEFHESGVIHYHMITDIKYIRSSKLAEIWGNGFVKIKRVYSVDNLGKYLVKYLKKDINDVRLHKEKAYLRSGNLQKPLKLYGQEAWKCWESNKELLQENMTWYDAYQSKSRGVIGYKEYILNQTIEGKIAREKKIKEKFEKMMEKELGIIEREK